MHTSRAAEALFLGQEEKNSQYGFSVKILRGGSSGGGGGGEDVLLPD